MMTAHADVPMAVRAIRAGAADFVEKPFEQGRLLDGIEQAIARAESHQGAADVGLRARFAELTPREQEVMQQMVVGLPNKLIAHELGMSPRTVEIHRGRVMQKTGAVECYGSAEEYLLCSDAADGCVLLDIHMPGISGLDFLHDFAQRGRRLPVLVLTASREERLKERALELGARAVLSKPVPRAALLDAVRAAQSGAGAGRA